MNKIYKVIWSKARNCYVVVSEIAKRNGKCSSSLNKKIIASFLAAGMTMAATVSVEAASAVGVKPGTTGAVGNASGTNSVAVGDTGTISRVSIKRPGTTTDIPYTYRDYTPGAYGSYDIAIGKAAAYGNRKNTTTGDDSTTDIGGYYTTGGAGRAIAVGFETLAVRQDTIAVGTYALAGGQDAIAIGRNARALTKGSIAIGGGEGGQQGTQGRGGINTPLDSPENGGYTIAIGTGATNFTYGYNQPDDYYANARNSIAIGRFAHTHAANAFAIGVSTDATAERSFSIGTTSTNAAYSDSAHHGARAGGQGSLTFGDQAVVGVKKPSENTGAEERGGHVLVNDAMAMGTNSWARARNAVALGGGMSYTYHQTSADGKTMTNLTQYYDGSGWVDRAEGTGAHVGLNADGGVAIGGATGTVDLNGSESHWPTTAPGAVSGYTAAASIGAGATRAVAIGSGAVVGDGAVNSVAIGARNIVSGVNSTAVGSGDYTSANKVSAYASGSFGNKNLIGKQQVDANGNLQPDSTTTNVFVVGGKNEIANASGNATSIGVFGSTNKIEGSDSTNSTMIGNSNTITNKLTNSLVAGNSNTGLDQVDNSQIIGNSNTAIGTNVSNLVVLGNSTTATGGISSAIALGQGTTIGANNAIAIGTYANSSHANSVALGSGSQTAAAVGTKSATIGSITFGTFAGAFPSSVVSIGKAGDERQLINVAAGRISNTSTDAVNGSQLYAAYDQLQWSLSTSANGGTVTGSLSKAIVGKPDSSTDRSNVSFVAGNGIFIASGAQSGGYKIEISSNFENASITDGRLTKITYEGKEYDVGSKVLPLGFTGDMGSSFNRNLGTTVKVNGGATGNLTEGNIGVVSNGTDTLTVKLAEDINLGKNGSVTTGNTKIDTNGLTNGSTKVTGSEVTVGGTMVNNTGLTISGGPSVTKTNVTMAGQQIHNVAAGSADTDAVNLAQLKGQQWRIGIGTDGGTGGTNGKDNNNALALTAVTEDKRDVQFLAGSGIDISVKPTIEADSSGFGVEISSRFMEADIDKVNGTINNITYDGVRYSLGDASAVRNVVSDKRAVVVENQGINREIVSPYIHIHGLDDENLNSATFAKASAEGAIAIGQHADAKAENTLAVGHNADADGKRSTAIGYNSHAHGPNSVSIGVAATSSGNRAIAIGTSATNDIDDEYDPSNPHQGARAAGQGSVVLGDRARALSTVYQSDTNAIGHPDTNVNDAIAIGTKAEVRAKNAIALGGNLSYTDENSTTTKYGSALGGREYGAVVGDGADSAIAIGGAYGSVDNNGNITQEMEAAASYGRRSIAIGTGALVANPDDFKKLETLMSTEDYVNAVNKFQEARSTYLAAKAIYDDMKDVDVNSQENMALPVGMRVTETAKKEAELAYNKALQAVNDATPAYKEQITKKLVLEAQDSVNQQDAIAIGTSSNAAVRDSIALGSHSVTNEDDRAGIRTGQTGYDVQTDSAFANTSEAGDPAWRSTAGSLSIGGGTIQVTGQDGTPQEVTVTRRISNVAAGVNDTDAVNVAQLKRAAIFRTDSRNTSIVVDDEGYMKINSPYLNISGVEEAAEAESIINQYGSFDKYKTALSEEINDIESQIQTTTESITNLNGQIDTLTKEINDASSDPQSLDTEVIVSKTTEKSNLSDQVRILETKKEKLQSSLKNKQEEQAKNTARMETLKEYVNSKANATGEKSMAFGYKANASEEESIAMGANTNISGKQSVGIGSGNTVTGERSIAIGAPDDNGNGNKVTGRKSIALGTGNEVYGDGSGAIGDPNVLATNYSYVIGNDNRIGSATYNDGDTITNQNVFIMGNNNHVDADQEHVYVLGSNVTATTANSVFLGDQSAYVAAGNRTAGLRTDYTGDTFNGITYKYAGGEETVGVVSVGNGTQTRRIQNVAPGLVAEGSTDAINGSQLYSAMSNVNNNVTNLGNQISNVENRTKKGLAGAAALAALHPLEFDPDDKLTFAAGMGHYRGENAAALGLFYRPDEKVMFSLGGTVGNGENMVNAGVSFSLDRTPRVTGSRTALTKEVVHLREQVARQDAQIAKQNQQIAMQGAQIAQLTALVSQLTGVPVAVPSVPQVAAPTPFPDNLDNKWAYDVIEDLEQRGYFTGYAGRELTRDEFAAALDRAMAGGAKLEERIIREFEPELSHVRVAHVEGKGNNEGEWYERPRASHDKYENKHEIAKKYSRVQEKKVTSKS